MCHSYIYTNRISVNVYSVTSSAVARVIKVGGHASGEGASR